MSQYLNLNNGNGVEIVSSFRGWVVKRYSSAPGTRTGVEVLIPYGTDGIDKTDRLDSPYDANFTVAEHLSIISLRPKNNYEILSIGRINRRPAVIGDIFGGTIS